AVQLNSTRFGPTPTWIATQAGPPGLGSPAFQPTSGPYLPSFTATALPLEANAGLPREINGVGTMNPPPKAADVLSPELGRACARLATYGVCPEAPFDDPFEPCSGGIAEDRSRRHLAA